MATSFEELMNNMVNAGLGVAAVAADKGKELLDDLTARGAQVRAEAAESDFGRSMADAFERAGGTFHDVTERVSAQGATVAERILDELILARVRTMTKAERVEFMVHVRDLVDSVDDGTVTVEVESVEATDPADEAAADDAVKETDE